VPHVCITGMYVSGTSLVTSAVDLLGIAPLSSARLVPQGTVVGGPEPLEPGNDRGVIGCNLRILRLSGGHWSTPGVLPDGWLNDPRLEDVRRDAAAFFEVPLGAPPGRGASFADPRCALTLPFWQAIVPGSRTIVAVRDPLGVVAELTRSYELDAGAVARLWVRHVTDALMADPDALVVDEARLRTAPEAEVERLGRHLGIASDRLAAGWNPAPSETPSSMLTPVPGGRQHPSLTAALTLHRSLLEGEDPATAVREALHAIERQAPYRGAASGARAAGVAERGRQDGPDPGTRGLDDELVRVRTQADAERVRLHAMLSAERQRASSLEAELRHAQDRAVRERHARLAAEQSLARLKRRRSVRLAMGIAEPFRPLIRSVRRLRSSGPIAAPSGSAPEVQATSLVGDTGGRTAWADGIPRWWHDAAFPARVAAAPSVTVVVPIHNAADELERCVASIMRHTPAGVEVLLIDDASTDPRVGDVLAGLSDVPDVRVLRNQHNLGFTATVNVGFEATDGDVVLLNSDTEVTPGWLRNLRVAAYRRDTIATATPLSNNAGAFSVPESGVANPVPEHLLREEVGRLVTQSSVGVLPTTPTGNGFCMYVKRAVIDDVGGFDADAFPRGYGEENDFCMRAVRNGWEHVVDDRTIIFHVREASFGAEKQELAAVGRQVVDARYPEYGTLVRAFVDGEELREVRARVAHAFAHPPRSVRPRLLSVVHAGSGGTPATTRDLMRAISDRWDVFVLESDTRTLTVSHFDGDLQQIVARCTLAQPLRFGTVTDATYRSFVTDVLVHLGIEVVHIRHLVKHTFDVPDIARALDLPYLVSFHDYYFSCPTFHLIDDRGRFCGGNCTAGAGDCRVPMPWVARDVPPLKHAWVQTWRNEVTDHLRGAAALVTTSQAAREVVSRSLPDLAAAPFHVIEHGRDLQAAAVAVPPRPGAPVRILVPGNLDEHKGTGVLRELKRLDTGGRLDLHFLGTTDPVAAEFGTHHGTYRREDFAERAAETQPAFVAILSPWGETYCHTLTEAWAAGIPVLCADEGALRERVLERGGGVLLDVTDPAGVLAEILRVADDEARYATLHEQARAQRFRTAREMSDDYHELYQAALRSTERVADDDDRLRLVVATLGGEDASKRVASAYVRTMQRLEHPRFSEQIRWAFVSRGDDQRLATADTLLVQRNGLAADQIPVALEVARTSGTRVVFDLDDALTEPEFVPDEWRDLVPVFRSLATAADVVTVSTEPLAELLRQYNEQVVLVPNALDERLWSAPVSPPTTPGDRTIRLLYAGTVTHAGDLALLRPVVQELRSRFQRHVVLEVIGGEPPAPGQDWYQRVAVPPGVSAYPRFVPWLRSLARRWTLGLAPLAATPFNTFKSDLKFLEYTGLGLPVVASDVPAYNRTVEDGMTGRLVGESPAAWLAAIHELLSEPEQRAQLAAAASAYVMGTRTLAHTLDAHLEVLRGTGHRATTASR
jgi:O-antigen biosynthesis protein